jgi:hypothetical protein
MRSIFLLETVAQKGKIMPAKRLLTNSPVKNIRKKKLNTALNMIQV